MIIKYRNPDLGLLLLRLGLAVIFLAEACTKFRGLAGTEKFFQHIGFQPWMAVFVAVVELIGGLVFLFGIFSEFGYVIAIEMAVIIIKLQLPHGWQKGFFEFSLLMAALAITLTGPGKYSIEKHFRKLFA